MNKFLLLIFLSFILWAYYASSENYCSACTNRIQTAQVLADPTYLQSGLTWVL
jgi:hypothetical protein